MEKKQKYKTPRNLSQYLRLKSKEYEMSESKLSKLIVPGSSGSLIASIRFDESKLSEKKIRKIADFFQDDPNLLIFMANRIPKDIHKLIMKEKSLQLFLLDFLREQNNKKNGE